MSLPGIPKRNISLSDARQSAKASTANTASLKARAGELKSAQRTSVFTRALGSSGRGAGWVGAQRGFNPHDHISNNANRFANLRAEANRYAGVYNMRAMANAGGNVAVDNSMETAMKAALGVQLGMQAAQTVFGLLNQAGVFGGDKIAGGGKADGPGSAPASMSSMLSTSSLSTATTLSGKLSSAGSFSDIQGLEQQSAEKKANLDAGYQELNISDSVNETLSGEGVQDGLKLAKVDIDTSALQLSNLDPNDLDASIKTIDTDINEITNFQTSTLPTAKAQVSEQSGIIGQQINSTQISIDQYEAQKAALPAGDSQIAELDSKIQELTKKKEQLEADKAKLDSANEALTNIESQCGEIIGELNGKKTEIEDMKKFDDNVKDKKYDLAKSQDEQLKKTMDSIDKLTKQIDSLADNDPGKATKSDQNRLAKYNSLIQERAGLYETLGTLTQSLSSAGETKFENSKGQPYTLKNLDKAMNFGQAPEVTPLPQGDAGTPASPAGTPGTPGAAGATQGTGNLDAAGTPASPAGTPGAAQGAGDQTASLDSNWDAKYPKEGLSDEQKSSISTAKAGGLSTLGTVQLTYNSETQMFNFGGQEFTEQALNQLFEQMNANARAELGLD